MAMRANADNLALKPDCVDLHLSVRKVEYIGVDEADERGFKVTILDFADSFDEDGGIQWKGRRPHWVMTEKGQSCTLQWRIRDGLHETKKARSLSLNRAPDLRMAERASGPRCATPLACRVMRTVIVRNKLPPDRYSTVTIIFWKDSSMPADPPPTVTDQGFRV